MTPRPCGLALIPALLALCLGPAEAWARTIDTSPRHAILFARSGRFIVADGWNSLALYRAADGRLLRRFQVKERINSFDATADEDLLLLACADGGVGVWEIDSGERLWWNGPGQTGLGYVYDACFARDGRSLVVCNQRDFALIFETRTGRQIGRVGFPPNQTNIMSAALSPDGSRGILVDLGESLFTFDVATGTMRDTELRGAWPVRFSSDGKHVACRRSNSGVSEQLRILTWGDPPTGIIVGQFAWIGRIRPTDNGGFLVSALAGNRSRDAFAVGVRWLPGSVEVEELWRSSLDRHPRNRTDFDPATLLGVSTDFQLVTELTDLRTGKPRLTIDNSGNYREEVVTSSSGGVSRAFPQISRLGWLVILLGLAGVVAFVLRMRKRRS